MEIGKEIEAILSEIKFKHDIVDKVKKTFGLAYLKDGVIIKILYNFELIAELWSLYTTATAIGDKSMVSTILTENTSGGIVDTGDTMINIKDVSAMVPVYRFRNDTQEAREEMSARMGEMELYLFGSNAFDDNDEDEDDYDDY